MSSTFASSTLARLLAQWAPGQAPAAPADLAVRLGAWVGAFDAIELQAANRAIRAMGVAAPQNAHNGRLAGDLVQAFGQARAALMTSISQDAVLPGESTYAAYKRRHLELQRQMEQMVGALREHVREALARATPPLRQLAALDAALDKVVARREQALLPKAALLLERRFTQLRKNHLKDVEASGREDDPATWRRPGQWLHAFEHDWRQALLAELELRLEPVAGLVEASGTELTHHQ